MTRKFDYVLFEKENSGCVLIYCFLALVTGKIFQGHFIFYNSQRVSRFLHELEYKFPANIILKGVA